MGTARPVPSLLRNACPREIAARRTRWPQVFRLRFACRGGGGRTDRVVRGSRPALGRERRGVVVWLCAASSTARRSSSSEARRRFVAAIPTAMRARARAIAFSRPRPTSSPSPSHPNGLLPGSGRGGRRPLRRRSRCSSGRPAASRRRGPRTRTRGPSTSGPGSRVNGQREGRRATCARSPAHATVALDRLRLMVSDEPPLDDDRAELLALRRAGPWRSSRATRGHAPGTRLSGMRAVVRARPAVADRDAAESPVPGSAGRTPCSPRSANTDATRTSGSPDRATRGGPHLLHRRLDVRFLISFVRPATGGERTFHMRPHTRGHRTRNN